jgi:hypothetical protein
MCWPATPNELDEGEEPATADETGLRRSLEREVPSFAMSNQKQADSGIADE